MKLKIPLCYRGNFHLCFFLTACHLHDQLFLFKNLKTIHLVFTAFLVVSGKLYILLITADSYFFPPSVLFPQLLQFEKQIKTVPPFVVSAWIETAKVRTRKNQCVRGCWIQQPIRASSTISEAEQVFPIGTCVRIFTYICVCIRMYRYLLTALNKLSGWPLGSAQSESSDFTSTHVNTALIMHMNSVMGKSCSQSCIHSLYIVVCIYTQCLYNIHIYNTHVIQTSRIWP